MKNESWEPGANSLRNIPSRLISRIAIHAHRLLDKGLDEIDAKRYHFSILSGLREIGPTSQAALGRHCGIDRSDVVEMVNELETRGFVGREPDQTDRRRNVVTITTAGTWHLQQLDAIIDGVQDEIFAPLGTEERSELVSVLQRVLDHHEPGQS